MFFAKLGEELSLFRLIIQRLNLCGRTPKSRWGDANSRWGDAPPPPPPRSPYNLSTDCNANTNVLLSPETRWFCTGTNNFSMIKNFLRYKVLPDKFVTFSARHYSFHHNELLLFLNHEQ